MRLQQILAKQKNISNIGRLTSAIQTISMVKKQQSKQMHDKMISSLSILKKEIKKMHYESDSKNVFHMVFTVDKKLCKNFIYLASNYVAKLKYSKNDAFMFFGKYAINALKNIENERIDMNIISSIEDSSCAAEIAMKYLMSNHQIKIHFYSFKHSKFIEKSIFKSVPVASKCSHDKEGIISICKLYMTYSIQMAAIETSMMENTSRATAMSQASDTCKNMQHQLKLDYNRLRQEKITLEMSEIIGGASA
ncbi:hypothetical protein FZC35_01965 [Candidatus Cytomitobacter indipagum]|uniref:F0F1 ATP synthase subunit gamma n=1 Tax=Candidatus Cytomitobacter indipagum TaxID=2601575 RepID=A0A5C0UEM6_9PROT|nr:F0F1 ATP synthase subunit gamma [Candidatus Cytomitobacter indipagum]QEK38131.1 hypothetical protein FZC35_01965 [Candidatus Cytomitobacter indipagum]